jgi:hypothetical protein
MFFYALWWSFCVELGALRTVSHRPQRVNPLPTKWPHGVKGRQMFFYALWWSFCVELGALRTVSHRPQRVKGCTKT